jgi:small-conductance mechanosensitive channel
MRFTIVQFYEEKRAIEKGLRDLGHTVGKLDDILMLITLVILVLIWLAIFNVSIQSYIVGAGSVLITASFVIGNSAKNVFDSIIFLFVLHPYDVGDKVEIENVVYTVKEIALMTTVLIRLDGQGKQLYFAFHITFFHVN